MVRSLLVPRPAARIAARAAPAPRRVQTRAVTDQPVRPAAPRSRGTGTRPAPPPAERTPASPPGPAVPVAVLAAVIGAFGYVGAVDPNTPGHYPLCPLLHFTGVLCPGCGGLRSAHALAHGDVLTALGANALLVAATGLFAAVWTLWLLRSVRGRPAPSVRLRAVHGWSLAATVALFTVVRNLPLGSALAP